MSDSSRRRPFVRFSVGTLLFLMLCLGGYLAGYRQGFNQGNQDRVGGKLMVVTYPVGDLIPPRTIFNLAGNYNDIIDLIVATVAPDTWMANGTGEGEIQPFPENLSLVISQTDINHQKIAALFRQLRNAPVRAAAKTPK